MLMPGGGFFAWTERSDDALWDAMKSRETVGVVMERRDGLYIGRGVPDTVSDGDVRIAGQGAKRVGRFAAFLIRRVLSAVA